MEKITFITCWFSNLDWDAISAVSFIILTIAIIGVNIRQGKQQIKLQRNNLRIQMHDKLSELYVAVLEANSHSKCLILIYLDILCRDVRGLKELEQGIRSTIDKVKKLEPYSDLLLVDNRQYQFSKILLPLHQLKYAINEIIRMVADNQVSDNTDTFGYHFQEGDNKDPNMFIRLSEELQLQIIEEALKHINKDNVLPTMLINYVKHHNEVLKIETLLKDIKETCNLGKIIS